MGQLREVGALGLVLGLVFRAVVVVGGWWEPGGLGGLLQPLVVPGFSSDLKVFGFGVLFLFSSLLRNQKKQTKLHPQS